MKDIAYGNKLNFYVRNWIKQWGLDAFYDDYKGVFDQYLKKYNIRKVETINLPECWESDHTGTMLANGANNIWFIIPKDLGLKALVLGGFPDESKIGN